MRSSLRRRYCGAKRFSKQPPVAPGADPAVLDRPLGRASDASGIA
jgi:hypothetical protein